ncbi:MAG: acetate kinase, partial [Candidatus Woesearchaeota archaeon]
MAQKTSNQKILVLNSGSSSLKFQVFELYSEKSLFKGEIDAINKEMCAFIDYSKHKPERFPAKIADHVGAVLFALKILL